MYNLAKKIAIGTAQFGLDYGIANKNGKVNAKEIRSILDLAYQNNIDSLDTAKSYGSSEKLIGDYLSLSPNTWNVITKVSDKDKRLIDQLQDSKSKLTVFPTIVLAHSSNLFLDPVFQVKLKEIRDKKLVNGIGVSIYDHKEINLILESNIKIDVVQIPMNILDTRIYRKGILSKLNDMGIEIHVRSVFLQGLFFLPKIELKKNFKDVIPYLEKLESISTTLDLTIPELSMLWVLGLKEVSKVIIGVNNAQQLKKNLNTLNKNISTKAFEQVLSIVYENEKVLNPSLWPVKS